MSEKKQDITHLRQRLAHSNIIVDATRRFTSTLDSDEIQLALFEAVFQIVGAQQIALHLTREEGLQSYICYPMEGLRTETAVLPPEATAFRICEEVKPVIWQHDDGDSAAPPISVEAIKQFASYLALPLKGADKVVGVIEAFNLLEPQNAVQQAALLAEIAGPASLAIYNGMLYREAQYEIAERKRIELEVRQKEMKLARRAAQLETVSRVSAYTSTILESDKLLQEVVDRTKDQFGLYHVHIYLVNEAGDKLDLAAGAGDVGRQMVAQGRSIPLQQKQSLVAQVARSGHGLIENDVLNNPAFLPHPLLPDTRAETAVPMILGGRVIGVLDVQSDRVDAFIEQDIHIQTTLAAHIAVALENARSYEHARTSLAETEALLDITKETSRVLELTNITDNVLDKVLAATNFDAGVITLIDPDTQSLKISSQRLPEQFIQMLAEKGLDGTLCDLVYRRQETIIVTDMAVDAPLDVTGLLGMGFRAYQGVPLESKGEVLGTLCIFSSQRLNPENVNSVFLQAIGQQVGIAIRNTALLEQSQAALSEVQQSRQSVQEYLDMQRVLHELNIELFGIDDLDELYRTAIELARTRLGFERVGMYLLNETKDVLLGTYGTDVAGNLCNEQAPEYRIDQKETIDTFVLNRTRLVVDEDIDLWYSGEVVGRGWHIGAAMWVEDSPIGVIFADNLLTGGPLKPYQAELLFAYAGIVSNLIQRNRFETIITKRAAEMQAVAEVGTAAATILDTDELLQEVVDLTRNSFDLYHAHIYLLNKETETLVLTSGAGTVGRQMVAEGRQISLHQEQSLVARAARSRQGVVINDVQAEPGFLPHPLLPNTRAEMAVPLITTGEQVLGVLDVQSDRLNYFTREDISTFTTLAAQTAVALQNARLFTQSEERAKELAFINRIVTEINASDIETGLQFMVEELGEILQVPLINVRLIDDTGTMLKVVAAHHPAELPSPVGTVLPVGKNPVNNVLQTRQTVVIEDIANSNLPPQVQKGLLGAGIRSLYIVPMIVGRDLIGSIAINIIEGDSLLTPSQLKLAETTVYQAATAVQNARLFEQAQTAFRNAEQSEQFLNTIINTIPNPIFYKDTDGVYIGMNQAFLETLGVRSDDLLGKSVFDLQTDKALAQKYHEMDVALFENPREPQIYESQLTNAAGQLRDVIFNKNVFYQADGSLGGLVGVILDITERKKSEVSLQERETLLHTIIDSTPDWIFVKDQNHRYQMVNKGYADTFQMPPQDFIGKNDLDIGFPEDIVKGNLEKGIRGFWADDLEIMESGQMKVIDIEPAVVGGEQRYLNTIKAPLKDADGQVTAVIGFVHDITDRILIEETLRQNEADLSQALKIAKLAYWEYDVEKDLFTFNDQFYALFHTTAEQHGGYQLPSAYYAEHFVYPDDLPIVGAEIDRALNSTDRHYSRPVEHRILYADGGVGYISVNINIDRDEQGKILRYYGANQDITERKQAEEALAKQARELQIVAELSTTVATTLEQEKLLQEVVDLTRERFDFYHSQIYLLNVQQDALVLAFGAGDVGRKLVDQKHQISLSAPQSLVARAARSGQAVVVNAVRENPDWLPNDLLPETQAEMAVPMMVGDRVVGVLDVQSERVNRFTDQDVQIQTTLAAQVSIALENARSFEQAQTAVAEMNALTRRLTREGWQDYLDQGAPEGLGYIFDSSGPNVLKPLSEATSEAMLWMEDRNGSQPAKPLFQPIAIHGETIGQLAVMPEDGEDEVDSEIAEIIYSVIEQLEARIENLRLTDQTQIALAETEEQAQRLGRLNEMSAALNQAATLTDVYNIAVAETPKVMAADRVSLALLNETGDDFEITAVWGDQSDLPVGTRLPIEEAPMFPAVQENRLVRGMIEGSMDSALYVPLVVGDKVIGTLNIGHKEARMYKASDENLLRQVATLVSSNIENMRFLTNEQARAQREQMLRQITQRIRSSADVETIMRTAVQEIGRTLGRKTYIYLGDDREA